MIDLSIIIVSYNTKDLLKQCLDSIFASKTDYSFEVIVVDNASTDGSADMINSVGAVREPPVHIIRNPKNIGFAAANNLGAAAARGRYLWLLNSDTEVFKDTIQKLLQAATLQASWIASCRLLNRDHTNQPQGGALPNFLNIATWMLNVDALPFVSRIIPPYQAYTPGVGGLSHRECNRWLGGTALLVRRDLYQSMQGLDENIFMYGEDVEFCLRAIRRGFPVNFFIEPKVVHYGQGSGNKEKSILGEYQGLKYVAKKHYSKLFSLYLKLMLKIGAFLRFVMYTIRGNKEMRRAYAKAFFLD